MMSYAGLDVGQQETYVCVVDGGGAVVFRGRWATEPGAIAGLLKASATAFERVAMEPAPCRPG